MRVRSTANGSACRFVVACAWGFALLSCGREPAAPYGIRFARSLSLVPVFPRDYAQIAGANDIAPFTSVRVLFLRASGATALDTVIAVPASADSLSFSFAVPLSADAPPSGEELSALIYCLDAQGDTLLKGGPAAVFASARGNDASAVSIALAYVGADSTGGSGGGGGGSSATKLVITTQPVNAAAGAALTLVASVEDATGAVVTTFTGAISVALGSSAGGASLRGTTTVNALAGVATFTGMSIVRAATGYTLAVTASGLDAATSTAFSIAAAAPASEAISAANNQSGVVGQLLGAPLSVTVDDAFGNPVPGVTVNWAVASGEGSLASSTAQTNASGVATDAWTLGSVLGTQTVTATAAGLANAPVTFTATAIVGAATTLVVSSVPAIVTAGTAIGSTLVVTAEDAAGNVVSSFTGLVSLALGSNPGGGALTGTTTAHAVAGVATFGNVLLTKAAQGYTVVASASGVAPVTTGSFSVIAAAAASIAKVGGDDQPNLVLSALGLILPTPLSVLVTDAFGNPVSGASVAWAVTLGNATLGSTSSQTDASGTATNNTVTLTGLAGGLRQISASVPGVATPAVFSETGNL